MKQVEIIAVVLLGDQRRRCQLPLAPDDLLPPVKDGKKVSCHGEIQGIDIDSDGAFGGDGATAGATWFKVEACLELQLWQLPQDSSQATEATATFGFNLRLTDLALHQKAGSSLVDVTVDNFDQYQGTSVSKSLNPWQVWSARMTRSLLGSAHRIL